FISSRSGWPPSSSSASPDALINPDLPILHSSTLQSTPPMQDQILSYLQQPGELEKLYRSNKSEFRRAFLTLYPEIQGKDLAEFWHERLSEEPEAISWGSRKEVRWIVLGILAAGILAKIPRIFSVDEEFFYPRNI